MMSHKRGFTVLNDLFVFVSSTALSCFLTDAYPETMVSFSTFSCLFIMFFFNDISLDLSNN